MKMPVTESRVPSHVVIIDNGTGFTKNGFGDEQVPRTIIPTVVKRKVSNVRDNTDFRSRYYTGKEAISREGITDLIYPIERCIIRNWDAMISIWDYTFYDDIKIDPKQYSILLIRSPDIPTKNRRKIAEIMFEIFNVPAIYLGIDAVLALFALERTTGLVVSSGAGATYIVPIQEGFVISHAVKKINLSGIDITQMIMEYMARRGFHFKTYEGISIARNIKESLCYVALDYEKELSCYSKEPEKNKERVYHAG